MIDYVRTIPKMGKHTVENFEKLFCRVVGCYFIKPTQVIFSIYREYK